MKNAVFWDIKNLVRTSQEAHHVSVTKQSRLILCKIRSFYGGVYEECRLLEPYDVTSQKTAFVFVH
jgi:hypothetical protein